MYGIAVEQKPGEFGMIAGPYPSIGDAIDYFPEHEAVEAGPVYVLLLGGNDPDKKILKWDDPQCAWKPVSILLTASIMLHALKRRDTDVSNKLYDIIELSDGVKEIACRYHHLDSRPFITLYTEDHGKIKFIPQDESAFQKVKGVLTDNLTADARHAREGHEITWVIKNEELKGKIYDNVWTSFKPW